MATQISHKPHIKEVEAGRNFYDPMHSSIFEVDFNAALPDAIKSIFSAEIPLLSQQVTKVGGLDALNRTSEAGEQKFLGVDVSYLKPVLSNTFAEITIELNLNIRNATDAYVFKVFKAWGKLAYDLADGTRTLMAQYVADGLKINEANRNGDIWRSVILHKVLLTKIEGLNDLEYTNSDARKLNCTFRCDWWDEDIA